MDPGNPEDAEALKRWHAKPAGLQTGRGTPVMNEAAKMAKTDRTVQMALPELKAPQAEPASSKPESQNKVVKPVLKLKT